MALSASARAAAERVATLLRPEMSLLFITGAGLSADSGLPTYRGVGGLYNDEHAEEGIPIEQALSGSMFQVRPDLVWKHIRAIEKHCQGARFNRGHAVIAEMERHFARVWTLTQNVDGFHRQAGSQHVIEIHGRIHTIICSRKRCDYRVDVETYDNLDTPPTCPNCGAVLRPDVVLFEEMLPEAELVLLDRELRVGFDIVFSVGTSSLFPYILEPVYQAIDDGVPSVEINPGETDVSLIVTERIQAGAAEALEAIWSQYQSRSG